MPPAGSTSPMLGHHDTVSRPEVTAGGAVTVEVPTLPTSYDVNSYTSTGYITEVAALTQPSPYLVDPYGAVALDTDVMHGTALYTDPQKVVYEINPKAVWSDGVAVSCRDFYLEWLVNTSQATDPKDDGSLAFAVYPNTLYHQVNRPRCSNGGRTVTVTFSTPTASWQNLFTGLLPSHIAAKDAGIANITTIGKNATKGRVLKLAAAYRKDFGTLTPDKAVSAGPYVVASVADTEIVLKRNPKWWGNPAGPESIRLVATADPAAAVQSLRNGEGDVASVTDQDPSQADRLQPADGITRTDQIWPVSEHIEFNMRRPLFTGKAGKALRQAMFQCVDRTAILDKVARPVNPEAALLGNVMVAPWDPAYTDHYRQYRSANAAKAKSLLQQAGWTLGKDGVFEHGSTKAHFTLGVLPKASRTAIGAMITQECAKAGIDITVADLDASRLFSGKFQAALFAWSAPISPADYAYTYVGKSGGNTSGYSNPKVDALFADIASDVKPRDETGRLNEIDEILAGDQVVLPLYDWSAVNLQSERVHTTVTNNYFWGGLVWDAYAWAVGS